MFRLITAIVTAVLAAAVFLFYTEPAYNTVQADQAQISQYNQALDKAAQLQQLKQTLLSRYNAFNPSDLTRLQTLLPDDADNIGLILELNALASRYGLALQNVDVSGSASPATPGSATVGAAADASQTYASITLTFSTQGTYADFVQFMTDLQSSLRIVDLVSLMISSPSSVATAPHAGTPTSSYNYQVVLRTYWLK